MPQLVPEPVIDRAAEAYGRSLGSHFEASAIAWATGQAFRLAGHPERAWQTWLDALRVDTARGWPVMMNALVEVAHELDRAQQTVDALAAQAHRLPELHLWIGVVAQRSHDLTTAERAFARAEQVTTGAVRFTATTERLRVLLALDRLEDALATASQAITSQPEHHIALRSSRAGILNRLGRPAEALVDLDCVLELHPGFAPAWLNRGSALLRLGQAREGTAALHRAVELDPTLEAPAHTLTAELGPP